MYTKKKVVAMLLAGGQGSRLYALTKNVAKPAVPYGGKYRLIDFPLSNCTNSGIDTVGVLTQYQPLVLNEYIGNGQPWDLDKMNGGVHVLPPYETQAGASWYEGTANAIYQNMRFIERYDPEYVVVLGGDHIYKMDYDIMLQEHIENGADCTIAVIDVPLEEASRFGIMTTDEKGRITEFAEKPENPKSTQASMGVYIFSTDALIKYLEEDEANPESENDFGKNVIPAMLADGQKMYAYLYKGYWRDVGTLSSYWAANMDAIGDKPELILNDPGWRIYYRHSFNYPQYIGEDARVTNSISGAGNEIDGKINNSVIFNNVIVEKDADIEGSIIMSECHIGKGAKIDYAIVDHGAVIKDGVTIIGDRSGDPVVIERDSVVSGDIMEGGRK